MKLRKLTATNLTLGLCLILGLGAVGVEAADEPPPERPEPGQGYYEGQAADYFRWRTERKEEADGEKPQSKPEQSNK